MSSLHDPAVKGRKAQGHFQGPHGNTGQEVTVGPGLTLGQGKTPKDRTRPPEVEADLVTGNHAVLRFADVVDLPAILIDDASQGHHPRKHDPEELGQGRRSEGRGHQ